MYLRRIPNSRPGKIVALRRTAPVSLRYGMCHGDTRDGALSALPVDWDVRVVAIHNHTIPVSVDVSSPSDSSSSMVVRARPRRRMTVLLSGAVSGCSRVWPAAIWTSGAHRGRLLLQ